MLHNFVRVHMNPFITSGIKYNSSLLQTHKSSSGDTYCYTPANEVQGVYRNHPFCLSIHLSVCPSVCADSCPAHNFFLV